MPDFLLEIGTEEIPARMIDGAREELARRVGDLLQRERLVECSGRCRPIPRRAAWRCSLPASLPAQPDVTEQVTGPSLKVAYKDGAPTPAAEAFARKAEVPVDALEKITTPKGEYLAATVQKKGRAGGGDSCRVAAQRNRRHLLGEEHVLARQVGRALRASGALAGHAARRRSRAAGVCRHSRRQTPAKAIASCRRDR